MTTVDPDTLERDPEVLYDDSRSSDERGFPKRQAHLLQQALSPFRGCVHLQV
jgi:hypothetical protein